MNIFSWLPDRHVDETTAPPSVLNLHKAPLKFPQFVFFFPGAAEQKQSMRQRVLRSRQGVRRKWEGGAQLSVHRGERRGHRVSSWCYSSKEICQECREVREEKQRLWCFNLWALSLLVPRAVSPTRGQCAAATGRPTGTTVSSTGTLVWPVWRSRWLMMDTVRVREAHDAEWKLRNKK